MPNDTALAAQGVGPEADLEYLEVTDTTCAPHFPKRTHDIMYEGRIAQVTFELGKPQPLPLDIAIKFLKDEAFQVIDPGTGKKYDPTPKQPEAAGGASFQLAPDEIVAKLDELTQEALYIRVKQFPGTEEFKKGTPKEKLISFLARAKLAQQPSAGAATKVDELDRIQAGDTVGGQMSEDQLKKLIPDEDANE